MILQILRYTVTIQTGSTELSIDSLESLCIGKDAKPLIQLNESSYENNLSHLLGHTFHADFDNIVCTNTEYTDISIITK